MIAALLGWTKLPQWALELIIIAIVAGGVWYWQHERFEAGIAAQVAKDTAQTNKIKLETAAETADLKARATTAEQAYDKEQTDNANYRSQHSQSVRLCAQPTVRPIVPATGGINSGNATTGSSSADVSKMSDGNSGSGAGQAGPDIGSLLGLLAAKADNVSGVLREYQARGVAK
jgi:hypothetical protein